jgi:hypothetical protein
MAVSARAQPLAVGKAEGSVTVNGKTFTVVAAYARVDEDRNLEVALVDRPLLPEQLDPEVPLDHAERRSRAEGLRFTIIREQGASRWSVSAGGCGGYCEPTLVFEPTLRSDNELAGRAFTRGLSDIVNAKVEFDVRFRAAIRKYAAPPATTEAQKAARHEVYAMGYSFNKRDYFRAARGSPDHFDAFVRAGMPVDALHPELGQTLLVATLEGVKECDQQPGARVVARLLALKADPNQMVAQTLTSSYGETPLMKAYPCIDLMRSLIRAGAKLSKPMGWRKPPWSTGRELMARAIADDDDEIVAFLISAGFDVRPDGPALLKEAAGKPVILKKLRAAGAR